MLLMMIDNHGVRPIHAHFRRHLQQEFLRHSAKSSMVDDVKAHDLSMKDLSDKESCDDDDVGGGSSGVVVVQMMLNGWGEDDGTRLNRLLSYGLRG